MRPPSWFPPRSGAALAVVVVVAVLAGCGSASSPAPAGRPARPATSVPPSPATTSASGGPAPLHFGHPMPVAAGAGLDSVSCGSPTFCIALDATGRAYRFDGTGWTGPVPATGQPIGPGSISVSCSNPTFCMAVVTAGSDVTNWNGSGWSGPVALDGANGLEAVGCAPSGYCAAVDAEGNAFAFSGNAWTGTSGDWGSVSAISCVTSSFCMSTSGGISAVERRAMDHAQLVRGLVLVRGRLLPDDDVLHGGGRLGRVAPMERSHLVGTVTHRTRTGLGDHDRTHADGCLLPLECLLRGDRQFGGHTPMGRADTGPVPTLTEIAT